MIHPVRFRVFSRKTLIIRPQVLRTCARCYTVTRPPTPLRLPSAYPSLLPLVRSTVNLVISKSSPYSRPRDTTTVSFRTSSGTLEDEEPVVPFLSAPSLDPRDTLPIGYLRPQVLHAIEADHNQHVARGLDSPWHLISPPNDFSSINGVSFAPWVEKGGKQVRTMYMEKLVREWKSQDMFHDILRGWSDEPYPVYHPPPQTFDNRHDPVMFAIERAALPLFGFPNYGCLLTAYIPAQNADDVMIWIPRRSLNKRTFPGKLDVTVGGGMSHGDDALSTIVRECSEEASLDAGFVKTHIRPVGVLPFPHRNPEGWILPGMYYLYDLPLPSDRSIAPKTNAQDGEVESFELMSPKLVLHNLLQNNFKGSSALAMVDFLIRHGFVTDETDPRYVEVCGLLRHEFPLSVPWR